MSKITVGDLKKTITVEQALEMVQDLADRAVWVVENNLEHWTDDEGLHQIPFMRDVKSELEEGLRDRIEAEISERMD